MREAIVVAIRIESEQREAEAIFAASRAVTTSDIATCPHEYRHHIQLETNRRVDRRLLYIDRDIEMIRLKGNRELCVPVGFRSKAVNGPNDSVVAVELPSCFISDIPRDAIGVLELHDDRLRIPSRRQLDVAGVHMELRLRGALSHTHRLRRQRMSGQCESNCNDRKSFV